MQTALIIMTLLGCDDTATRCHYIETVPQRFETVAACDAATEAQLTRIESPDYPVIVATCQAPARDDPPVAAGDGAREAPAMILVEAGRVVDPPRPKADVGSVPPDGETVTGGEPALTARALAAIRAALPERQTIAGLAQQPVHIVTDTYAWAVRRVSR
ncbi:hypothetical protein ACLB6G_19715 [Zhengella sp. ZM62]|uniref:hypothetical protein n=1 Tax=Zhengella sedimenti TaxID=3390035 RepID=UPI003975F990